MRRWRIRQTFCVNIGGPCPFRSTPLCGGLFWKNFRMEVLNMLAAVLTPQRSIFMAMRDIKSIEVVPEDEEKTVRLWMSFGWELKNNQRVKTQDVQRFTGQDSDGTEHYQTTRGVDFIKLTFERDPERKNYAELKSLEEQYYAIPDPVLPTQDYVYPVRFGLLWGILTAIGLFLYVVPGIIIIVWRLVRYKKKVAEVEPKRQVFLARKKEAELEVMRKSQEILKKAQSLV
jgi:hypothetical protein